MSWGVVGIVNDDAIDDWVFMVLYKSDDNIGVYVLEPVFAGLERDEMALLSSRIARFEVVLANGTASVVLRGRGSGKRGSGILSVNRTSAVDDWNRGCNIKDRLERSG